MRTLPNGLQAHLDQGATTLCHCWKMIIADGRSFTFSDHDRPLQFDGDVYEPASGFSASEIESSLGLSVDNLDVAGALRSQALNEAELAAGVFDNATVILWRVNWAEPAQRVMLRYGQLGEVVRSELGFSAEIRGLAHQLNQPRGRIYRYGCDAVIGDHRCQVDLSDNAFNVTATIIEITDNRLFKVSGAAGFIEGWFNMGKLTWLDGDNQSVSYEIKNHRITSNGPEVELWHPAAFPATINSQCQLTAGCDKQFSTCRNKFANSINFRGFPHMPGDDFITYYPTKGDTGYDGNQR